MNLRNISFLVLIFASTWLQSQDSCSDILNQGVHDEYSVETYDQLVSKIESVINKSWDDAKAIFKRSEGDGGVAITELIKAYGGGSSESKSWEKLQGQYSKKKREVFMDQSFKKLVIRRANDTIVTAWADCMGGKRYTIYYTGDPKSEVLVTFCYKGGPRLPNFVDISDISFSNFEMIEGASLIGRRFNEGTNVTAKFRRIDIYSDASIQLGVDGVEVSPLKFPAYPTPPPPIKERTSTLKFEGNSFTLPLKIDRSAQDNAVGAIENAVIDISGRYRIRNRNKLVLTVNATIYEVQGTSAAADRTRWNGSKEFPIKEFAEASSISLISGSDRQRLVSPFLRRGPHENFSKSLIQNLSPDARLMTGAFPRPNPNLVNRCIDRSSSSDVFERVRVYFDYRGQKGEKGDAAMFDFREIQISLSPVIIKEILSR